MAVHSSKLLGSAVVAEGTMAFRFARPSGFDFKAGQNMLVTLVDPQETDAKGPNRTFTIASAPHEPDLLVVTRMRDTAFKRTLKNAAPGLAVKLDGPNGVMTLHEDSGRPAVFLAGGVGITPFLSMARDAARRGLPHKIRLFYSNRRPEDAAFLDELQALEKANPNYKLVATMAEMEKSARPWSGERGVIDRALVERYVPDVKAPIYYLAGPPGMTMAMQSLLESAGVSDDDIRSEEFYGY